SLPGACSSENNESAKNKVVATFTTIHGIHQMGLYTGLLGPGNLAVFDFDETIFVQDQQKKISLVEGEATKQFVKALKEQGCKIMFLTTRALWHMEGTFKQVDDIDTDIDFSFDLTENAPCDDGCILFLDHGYAAYENGYLFCGESIQGNGINDKGAALIAFLKKNGATSTYKSISFIDDQLQNVTRVMEACIKENIFCDAYHYTYVEETKNNKPVNSSSAPTISSNNDKDLAASKRIEFFIKRAVV
ncbi:MAG: DUF2608 domain-containing protein, partial [Candidatus Babeliales bacterium]